MHTFSLRPPAKPHDVRRRLQLRHFTQLMIKTLAIFYGHRLTTENTLSLLLHLASTPRDGSARRGRTETAATGRLCRLVLFFLLLSFFVSLFLTLSARPTPVSFKVTSHAVKPRGKRRKQGPFLLGVRLPVLSVNNKLARSPTMEYLRSAYPATRSTPDTA